MATKRKVKRRRTAKPKTRVVYRTRKKKPVKRRKKRAIKQKFGVTFKDVATIAAGAVAANLATKFLGDKVAKITDKLPMSDKINYTSLIVGVAGTVLAQKSKKSAKLIGLGMGAAGVAGVVGGFIGGEKIGDEFEDVQAELLAVNGVQRIADYDFFNPVSGVQRIADEYEDGTNYETDSYDFRTY